MITDSAWSASKPYNRGDLVSAANPLTWWDRVRMFCGLKRASPAQRLYEVGQTYSSRSER